MAKTTEAVQILLNFGAKTSNVLKANDNKTNIDDKTNIDEFLDNHSEETSKIILNECLEEINEDLIVFNFEPFEDMKKESHEMDLHKSVKKNNRSQLLLHPIMQAFLHLKWKQVKGLYFVFMCFEVAFVLALSFLGYDFVRMTFCNYCGEKYMRDEPTKLFLPRNNWTDDVPPYHQGVKPLGELKCFIKSEENCEPEDNPEDCNKDSKGVREEFCKNHNDTDCAKFKDKDEKYPRKDFCQGEQNKTKRDDCAKVTFENGSTHLIDMQEEYHFWCHKYFLR